MGCHGVPGTIEYACKSKHVCAWKYVCMCEGWCLGVAGGWGKTKREEEVDIITFLQKKLEMVASLAAVAAWEASGVDDETPWYLCSLHLVIGAAEAC